MKSSTTVGLGSTFKGAGTSKKRVVGGDSLGLDAVGALRVVGAIWSRAAQVKPRYLPSVGG